jgi:hypothetical protein
MLMGGGYPGSYFLDYGAAPPSLELALRVTDRGAARYLVLDDSGYRLDAEDV